MTDRKLRNVFVAALAASLAFALLGPGIVSASQNEPSVQLVKTLTYKDFHDPGKMVVVDEEGHESTFWGVYKFIGFEAIQTWKSGEQLQVVWKPGAGAGIVRVSSGAFFKLAFAVNEEHPISVLGDRCTDHNGSTMGMQGCLGEESKRWDEEYDLLVADLLASASDELKADLGEANAAWEEYKGKFFDAYYHRYQGGGTVEIINRASLSVWFRMNRVRSLNWLE